MTGAVPGLDKMMAKMVPGNSKPKETVIIDENFSTDDVKIEVLDDNQPNMANMMNMFSKISNMTDDNGNMDISSFMKQMSKDTNMTDDQIKQMEEMVGMVDNMDLGVENVEELNDEDNNVDNYKPTD